MRTVYRGALAWILDYWCRRMGRPPAEGEIEPQTRAYWEEGRRVSAGDYLSAIEQLQRISRQVAGWFDSYDAWLTPSLGAAPPPIGALTGTADDPLRGAHHAAPWLPTPTSRPRRWAPNDGGQRVFDRLLYNAPGDPYNEVMTSNSHIMTVSQNGQVSIPAEARARWGSRRVLVVDLGDRIVVRPLGDEPIDDLRGKYRGRGPSTDRSREQARTEDAARRRRR